jgi:hypothetical protein
VQEWRDWVRWEYRWGAGWTVYSSKKDPVGYNYHYRRPSRAGKYNFDYCIAHCGEKMSNIWWSHIAP